MIGIGDRVRDPRPAAAERTGIVLEVRRNPACLLGAIVVRWQDGEEEELEETAFGPLED